MTVGLLGLGAVLHCLLEVVVRLLIVDLLVLGVGEVLEFGHLLLQFAHARLGLVLLRCVAVDLGEVKASVEIAALLGRLEGVAGRATCGEAHDAAVGERGALAGRCEHPCRHRLRALWLRGPIVHVEVGVRRGRRHAG